MAVPKKKNNKVKQKYSYLKLKVLSAVQKSIVYNIDLKRVLKKYKQKIYW